MYVQHVTGSKGQASRTESSFKGFELVQSLAFSVLQKHFLMLRTAVAALCPCSIAEFPQLRISVLNLLPHFTERYLISEPHLEPGLESVVSHSYLS